MKAAIIIFPGTNRDKDLIDAITAQHGENAIIPVFHKESKLPDNIDIIILPGGFSFADYLRSGAIAAHSPIMQEVINAAKRGIKIIGICNGFQILCESGLLEGALLRNRNRQFICETLHLRIENNNSYLTKAYAKGDIIKIPVAHAHGNYYADSETLKKLENNGQILLRYCDPNGDINNEQYNPNGSQHSIAGISNKSGSVIGFMPHPENAVFSHHTSTDGHDFFRSLAA